MCEYSKALDPSGRASRVISQFHLQSENKRGREFSVYGKKTASQLFRLEYLSK